MSRITLVTVILLVGLSSQAAAYVECERYKFGSQEWWQCQSNQGPAQSRTTSSERFL